MRLTLMLPLAGLLLLACIGFYAASDGKTPATAPVATKEGLALYPSTLPCALRNLSCSPAYSVSALRCDSTDRARDSGSYPPSSTVTSRPRACRRAMSLTIRVNSA